MTILKKTTNVNCPIKYSKLIIKRSQRLNDCKNDNFYILEYNNICYQEFPSGTNKNIKNICDGKIKYKEDSPFLYIDSNECCKSCSSKVFLKEKCIINNENNKNKQNIIDNIISDLKNNLLNDLLLNVTNGKKI